MLLDVLLLSPAISHYGLMLIKGTRRYMSMRYPGRCDVHSRAVGLAVVQRRVQP
jgi:hypothetical protein